MQRTSRRGSGSSNQGQTRSEARFGGRRDRGSQGRTSRTSAGTSSEGDSKFAARPRAADGARARVSRSASGDGRPRSQAGRPRPDQGIIESRDDTPPEFVAGRHPVLEALKSGRPINKIVVADTAEGGSLTEILGKARALGVIVQRAPKAHLSLIAGEKHQGVLAYLAPQAYVELEDVMGRKTDGPPLVILLDEITDPYNLGAILRTAEATGAQGVVIPKRRAAPLTGIVAKAAAGALEYVPVARVANLTQSIERLKEAGYWIVGTDVAGEAMYTQVDYRGKIAVVIGAEGKGLSRLVKERCDYLVRLPMLGRLQSLNASVAAGVLLYEVVKQRG